jgi:drug/metabolite transporter (DMT)-like permease
MSAGGPSAAGQSAPHPLLGIALIVGASAFFALLDAVIKILAERYSPVMLGWTRYFFHLAVMLLVFGRSHGMGLIRTRRPLAQIGRGAALALSHSVSSPPCRCCRRPRPQQFSALPRCW